MDGPAQPFVIVDLRVPFFRLVVFFIKAALALIPAAIFLGLLAMLVTALLAAALGSGEIGDMLNRWGL
jgi:hypothetical protein